jgi:hypothetical protein
MKEKFSEYYKLNDTELRKHWQKDVFTFDANVLLNLYRYTPKTRDAFFSLLEKLKDRVWISYQAAFEYQKNRLDVINKQREAYDEIRNVLDKKKGEIEAKLNEFKRHPYLKTAELKIQIESAFLSINKDIQRLEKDHPDYLENDPIWEKLTSILMNRIGDDCSSEELEKIYRDGKKRYEDEIPPGYKDKTVKKEAGNRSLYGDIVVWKQIIKHAKEIEPSIIFITDDRKEDWWFKFKGKTIGPRPELIKEFKDESNKRVNIYQADNFIELASRNLNEAPNTEAIEEIRTLRLADEQAIALELKSLDALFEDDGVDKWEAKRIAKEMLAKESSFEKSIRNSIEENEKKKP